METAFLLMNIAMVKSLLNGMNKRFMVSTLFIPLVGSMLVFCNIMGWMVSKIFSKDDLMPFSYHFILKKNESS